MRVLPLKIENVIFKIVLNGQNGVLGLHVVNPVVEEQEWKQGGVQFHHSTMVVIHVEMDSQRSQKHVIKIHVYQIQNGQNGVSLNIRVL